MIHSLDYSVAFPSTGRTFDGSINFRPGLTAITGPNEAGKSLLLEMIRFALYGSAALRGPASDYKTLRVVLEVTIRGSRYRIERAINKAKILRGTDEIATGVTPVNTKVIDLMGFGLPVFDVACVANQADMERLGSMKPVERKRMVDSVIGLGVIEDLAKWAAEEQTAAKRLASELSGRLQTPVQPVAPDEYRPSAELEEQLEALKADQAALNRLEGWLSHKREAPEQPECEVTTPLELLETAAEQHTEAVDEHYRLQTRLRELPDPPTLSLEELDAAQALWDAAELWAERQAFLRTTPMPEKTADEISSMQDELNAHEKWVEYERQRKFVEDLAARGEHVCPECDHHWPVAGRELEEARARLVPVPKADKPAFTGRDIASWRQELRDWEARADEWARFEGLEKPEAPRFTARQIRDQREAHDATDTRVILEANLAEAKKRVDKLADVPGQLALRRAFEHAMASYASEVIEFETYIRERRKKQAEADRLEKVIAGRADLPRLHQLCQSYEAQLERYAEQRQRHDEQSAEIAEIRAEAEQWKLTREALMRVRSLVKQHLVPSLNRVASWMISEMTGGQRNVIEVDEEFNIEVDGQLLDTLSGSGKAVANLALRLALGQVLTQGVFPVFMADEIDASMDRDRAGNTTEVLRTLAVRISQVYLVTHKFPEADYYVETGNAADGRSDGGVKATFRSERGLFSREPAQGRVSKHFREDA